MRWSLRRLLQWVFFLVVLQVVVYFWSIKRPTKVRPKFKVHEPLQPAMGLDGTCSFKNCPKVKDGMLNVHLVPHSHIDVGWLKTVDQYYTGEKPPFDTTERGCVRCTLNTTIQELLKNPQRRFIFIEMKYLARYWQEADDTERESIRLLIKERRLELINGGWVMSDAGVTTYNDIIDQHTLGFNFISETFGACAHTRTAWHVDQFGHSREHASIFAQMGYDALVISRIDYQDLTNRKKNKDMELIWNTSPRNLKNRSTLFTHVTYDGYYAPAGFVLDSADSMTEVSERDALLFIKAVKYRAECYKSNHLLLPMGSDFGYKEAGRWFKYMDPLIEEVNKLGNSGGFKVNVVYSTPSCYTHYVNLEKLTFATKADDFHPYQSDHSTSWTGYYTTRGGLKKHIKLAGQILQSCKQLAIFAGLDASFNQVNVLRDQMAVAQHHDAITGTQKKHVLNDYNLLLSNATNACQAVMSEAYQKLWDRTEEDNNLSTVFCYGLNISSCPVSETMNQFLLTVYNPLSWTVLAPIRFPVRSKQLSVTDADGYKVPYQTLPVPAHILSIPERKPTTTQTDAVLIGSLLPMSVTTFSIQQDADESQPHFDELLDNEDKITLENEYIALKFWKSTGLLYAIHNKERDMIETLNQEFYFYEGQDNVGRNSGAYVFRPKHPTTKRVGLDAPVTVRVVKGPLVQEVHQTFCPWVSQVVRLYKGAKYAEFQWIVGPIDTEDGQGKEVVSLFTSNLQNDRIFYTDSNGREMIERVQDMRETWDYRAVDPISGNYYPVTSRMYIQDRRKDVQLSVVTDRPQGGTSLGTGLLELMVHRRLLRDDGLGVDEPLNDEGVDRNGIIFTGKHYVVLDTIANSAKLLRHLALQVHLEPTVMFTPVPDKKPSYKMMQQQTFLTNPLPDNVHILTLDRISANETNFYLLRLEHVYEADGPPESSAPAHVTLENLFKPFDIYWAEETTLGGNFSPDDVDRLQWTTNDGDLTDESINSPDFKPKMEPPFNIILHPMEIRTFRVQIVKY